MNPSANRLDECCGKSAPNETSAIRREEMRRDVLINDLQSVAFSIGRKSFMLASDTNGEGCESEEEAKYEDTVLGNMARSNRDMEVILRQFNIIDAHLGNVVGK